MRQTPTGRCSRISWHARKETQSVDLEQPNAWIVSTANAPLNPSFPQKPLFIAVALVLATGLGLILVFLAEQLERGMQTQDDVEHTPHQPSLGMIPLVKRNRLSRKPPQDYALTSRRRPIHRRSKACSRR